MTRRERFLVILNRRLLVTGAMLTIGSLVVLGFLAFGAEAVQVQAPASPVCVSEASNNYCAPVNDPSVAVVVAEQEDAGRVCGSKPILTDAIVFQFSDKSVKAVTFDEALKAGKAGGWIQAYCV